MASPNHVNVKNISVQTSDKEIRDFFAFCGKITDIKLENAGETKTADVTFDKETAAKTALLLNDTQLGPNRIQVSGTASEEQHQTNTDRDSDEITQEEKPRSRIFAEYLAHGYVVGDAALKAALDLDQKHGVSNRFVSTLQNLDQKYHATDRAKTTDQSYGITAQANNLFSTISSYFEKAADTPTGQRVVNFYTAGQRQVEDIHNEARRLADLKKEEAGGSAYKAAGLEKVFGKEKEGAAASGVKGETAATTNETTNPPTSASAAGGVTLQESEKIPK